MKIAVKDINCLFDNNSSLELTDYKFSYQTNVLLSEAHTLVRCPGIKK